MPIDLLIAFKTLFITATLCFSPLANAHANAASQFKLKAGGPGKISLGCKNPGTQQDVAKTPVIINTTDQMIGAGVTLYWSATDGDKGALTLQSSLTPKASAKAAGAAGNSYSCTAWMYR